MIAIFANLIQSASNLPTDVSALESSMSALESEIGQLESSSVPLEHWIWIFTSLVAVGVAVELWVILHEYRGDKATWASARSGELRSTGRPSITKLIVEVGSVLLITIGVTGELGIGIRIASINGVLRAKSSELRSKSDQLIALVTQQAGSANTSAKGAAEAASEATASADTLKKYLAQLATPRDIIISDRDGDHEERTVRFAEVKKYPGTVVVIQWIPEFEPQTYARHLAGALNDCGWRVELTTPQQSHIPYELMQEGVRVATLEESLFEPGDPSSAKPKHPFPSRSKAFAPATALVKLLDLDLGPPYGPEYFGVHWQPEWNDPRFSSFTKLGVVFPDAAVLVLVGSKPAEYAAPIHKKQKKQNAAP